MSQPAELPRADLEPELFPSYFRHVLPMTNDLSHVCHAHRWQVSCHGSGRVGIFQPPLSTPRRIVISPVPALTVPYPFGPDLSRPFGYTGPSAGFGVADLQGSPVAFYSGSHPLIPSTPIIDRIARASVSQLQTSFTKAGPIRLPLSRFAKHSHTMPRGLPTPDSPCQPQPCFMGSCDERESNPQPLRQVLSPSGQVVIVTATPPAPYEQCMACLSLLHTAM